MKHFVMADLHGNMDIYNAALSAIEDYCQNEEYKIIFLGDACDRGENGYFLMTKMLENPKITYLLGNHELLFVKCAAAILANSRIARESPKLYFNSEEFSVDIWNDPDIFLHMQNGGLPTLKQWINCGASEDIIKKINNLPLCATFGNVDVCHAGCKQSEWKTNSTKMLISRDHFDEKWFDERILVHGHTPVKYLPANYAPSTNEAVRYNGNKINLDTGAYATGRYDIYVIEEDKLLTVAKK